MLAGPCSQPRLRVSAAALVACALVLALVGEAQGAPGDLDRSFSGDGKQITDFAGGFDAGTALAVQRDGKIVVVGSARKSATPGSDSDFAVARYHVDGSLDESFSGDGKQTTRFGGWGRAVAVQADGKIVVAGSSYQGVARGDDFAVARYNA
ncbi:MAG: calcium-binding protein, partial [Solirubrobacterales bacterium]|nr:calcium-binding protein [Solirubrobacterales bacterium]